jgi:hypothetical protein
MPFRVGYSLSLFDLVPDDNLSTKHNKDAVHFMPKEEKKPLID